MNILLILNNTTLTKYDMDLQSGNIRYSHANIISVIQDHLHIAGEIKNQNISIKHINTQDNIAGILTKPLSVKNFSKLTENWIY